MKLKSIYLENFRSYDKLKLNINNNNLIILTGKNGTGKTNLLEAISFLSPGRGFRNSKLSDILKKNSTSSHWLIHSEIENGTKKFDIGVGFYPKKSNHIITNAKDTKIIKIDGKKVKKQSDLLNILSLIWLIPEMDFFFRTNSSIRRKFLDRLIFNLNPDYILNVRSYDKNLKERYKLLNNILNKGFYYQKGKDSQADLWLNKIEEKLIDDGIKIYIEREKFVRKFNSITTDYKNFPKIKLLLDGYIEDILITKEIIEIKKIYLQKVCESRKIDSIKGRVSYGPNKSDLKTLYIKKNITADKCSTGEQKIILIAIIIQYCKLVKITKGISPILILDELVAHLDDKIRISLFNELKSLNTQVWMSGADKNLFKSIQKDAENLEIEEILKQ